MVTMTTYTDYTPDAINLLAHGMDFFRQEERVQKDIEALGYSVEAATTIMDLVTEASQGYLKDNNLPSDYKPTRRELIIWVRNHTGK